MMDARCKLKVRERRDFYLFIKYKESHIYYAKFPLHKKTVSTGCMVLKDAYIKAYEIMSTLDTTPVEIWKTPENKDDKCKLNSCLKYLKNKTKPITAVTVKYIQEQLMKKGQSGKTINNKIFVMKRYYNGKFPDFTTIDYTPKIRKSFKVKDCYNIYRKMDMENPLHRVIFFTMVTGCRAEELHNIETVTLNGKSYLQINGTKTKNAIRRVPLLPEAKMIMEHVKVEVDTKQTKKYVLETARLLGVDDKYTEENNIVFHCFRRLYKTLLESAQVPNVFIEAWLGHSHTKNVDNLYFDVDAADDDVVYDSAITALRRFV